MISSAIGTETQLLAASTFGGKELAVRTEDFGEVLGRGRRSGAGIIIGGLGSGRRGRGFRSGGGGFGGRGGLGLLSTGGSFSLLIGIAGLSGFRLFAFVLALPVTIVSLLSF